MSKKVIVTGAAGLLGRHVAAAFTGAGYAVTALDIDPRGVRDVQQADLMDPDTARSRIADTDCVAHIASIPRPIGYDPRIVFETNMGLMFNILDAMTEAGVRQLVFASSYSVLGLPFAPRPVDIRYFPIDEDHPAAPQDVYAITKWLGEEMVDAWVRRTGNRAVSIRMPWVQTEDSFVNDVGPRRITGKAYLDLWAYIDARDAAKAFVQSCEARTNGHERFYVSAADTYSETPTQALLEEAYPKVRIKRPFTGYETLISNRRAGELIGFEPVHSWRGYGQGGGTDT